MVSNGDKRPGHMEATQNHWFPLVAHWNVHKMAKVHMHAQYMQYLIVFYFMVKTNNYHKRIGCFP